jgi:hypothetical protein
MGIAGFNFDRQNWDYEFELAFFSQFLAEFPLEGSTCIGLSVQAKLLKLYMTMIMRNARATHSTECVLAGIIAKYTTALRFSQQVFTASNDTTAFVPPWPAAFLTPPGFALTRGSTATRVRFLPLWKL